MESLSVKRISMIGGVVGPWVRVGTGAWHIVGGGRVPGVYKTGCGIELRVSGAPKEATPEDLEGVVCGACIHGGYPSTELGWSCAALLTEIDEVLQSKPGVWVGGRLDTIKDLVERVGSQGRSDISWQILEALQVIAEHIAEWHSDWKESTDWNDWEE